MVTVVFEFPFIDSTSPLCVFVSVSCLSIPPESLVSPSAHPGGARAPPGGQNRGRPAGPGAAQELGELRLWSANQCVTRPLAVSCPPGDVGRRESDGETRAEGK